MAFVYNQKGIAQIREYKINYNGTTLTKILQLKKRVYSMFRKFLKILPDCCISLHKLKINHNR